MWDIISYDYDSTISEEEGLQNVLKKIKLASVIVFHDSLKAEKTFGMFCRRFWEIVITNNGKSTLLKN